MLKQLFGNQKGFTLIEIVAVLVVLGILAAVAVPKYIDLQDDARKRAMQGALAEGMSTMNMSYAKLLLSTGYADTNTVAGKAALHPPESNDFSYTFSASGLVQVAGKANSDFKNTPDVSKQWSKPK